jgi:cell division protein FtsQ
LLAAAVVTTLAGAAFWVGWQSPALRLQAITVNGTSRLTVAEVLSAAHVPIGGSLLSVPVGQVARRVERLPAVADVHVRRLWPHRLVIAVVERRAVAAVPAGPGISYLVDASGVAFATAAPSDQLVPLQVPAPSLGEVSPAARAALTVWTQLPNAVRREVRTMAAPTPDDVSFTLVRGATVVWGSAADSGEKLGALAALLRTPASVYDVSTPSVAVTR